MQTAGKLPAEKPKFSKDEKRLELEYNRNPYYLCMLYTQMAAKRKKQPDKEFLLTKALKFAKEADDEECEHLKNTKLATHYILSTLLDDIHLNKKSTQFVPFTDLYNPNY